VHITDMAFHDSCLEGTLLDSGEVEVRGTSIKLAANVLAMHNALPCGRPRIAFDDPRALSFLRLR
jgi:hypothetical protein